MRVVLLSVLVLIAISVVVPNELYTPQEQRALKKFHSMVDSELPHAYMREDSYLINWIRSAAGSNGGEPNVERFQNLTNSFYKFSSEFDLNKAKRNLEATLKWRKDENVDNVLNEDFSYFKAKYPFQVMNGQNGGAVVTSDYENWNIKEATEEDPVRMQRYFYYLLETVTTKARINKSNISFLANARVFNPVDHGCEKCLGVHDVLLSTLRKHYPQLLNRFVIINAPEEFAQVDSVINKSLTKDEMKRKKTYGDNAEEYLQDLDSFIPLKNIPQEFVKKPVPTEAPKPIAIPDWLSHWKACGGCSLG